MHGEAPHLWSETWFNSGVGNLPHALMWQILSCYNVGTLDHLGVLTRLSPTMEPINVTRKNIRQKFTSS